MQSEEIISLIQSGADPLIPLFDPAILALGPYALIELLVSTKPIDLNIRSDSGMTILHLAVTINNTNAKVIELLLKFGADANARTSSGDTPLHMTSKKEIAKILVVNGHANVLAKNLQDQTPLLYLKAISDIVASQGRTLSPMVEELITYLEFLETEAHHQQVPTPRSL